MLCNIDVNLFIIRIITFVEHHVSESKVCTAALSILNTFLYMAPFIKCLCNNRMIELLLFILEETCTNGDTQTNIACNYTLVSSDTLLNLIQHNSLDVVRVIKNNNSNKIDMN